MYNEYIYEKKLNEEKLKEITKKKQLKYRKIHIKEREKLSKEYDERIENFKFKALNQIETKFNNPTFKNIICYNRFMAYNNNSSNRTNINNKNKINIIRKLFSNNSSSNYKHKNHKTVLSPLKNNENNTVNYFELPKMRFGLKNDLERIKEYLYKRNGEVLDEKILKKLNKRYKKKINKQNYDFLRTNQDSSINNNTINNIYPLNIDKNRILNKVEDKKEESMEEKKYAIFKNKILNSKLIINITNKEKYKNKTFYQGLIFSLLNQKKNKNNYHKIMENKEKFNQINQTLTPRNKNNHLLLKKRIQKEKERKDKIHANSINFYQDNLNKFPLTFYGVKSKDNNDFLFEESSDSSVNDNGQEEIAKKIISLNFPILNNNDREETLKDKNNLMYLKKLFEEGIKKEKHKKKIFMTKDNEFHNYYERKRYENNNITKYFFLRRRKKFKLVD